jgi:hypothetical protein
MIDARFRPLPEWPHKSTPSYNRGSLGGKQTFTALIDRLETELNALSATDIVIATSHRPEDIRNDGWPRSQARKPSHPGVILYFTAKRIGPLSFACDAYTEWQDNLRDIAITLEDLRALERRKSVKGGEQYKGWLQLPAAPPSTPKEDAARVLLRAAGIELTETGVDNMVRDYDTAKNVYRLAVRQTHPDTGGSSYDFQAVRKAWEAFG